MSKTPKNVDLLQQLIDNIDDNIFFKDSDSKFIMINKSNADWFGLDDPRDIVHRSVQALVEGNIVGLPTDTVYGLAVDALSPTAIEIGRPLGLGGR